MEYRTIKFSPPDISELEIQEVAETLRSGWITTGLRTKLLERRLASYIEIDNSNPDDPSAFQNRLVCLSSATAAEEMVLRLLGIGPGDEVIVPAYTYSASASCAIHCGAKVVFVDVKKDGASDTHMPEMDYDQLETAINERTKAIIPVDLFGIVCDYERVFEIVERKRALFQPVQAKGDPLSELSARIQKEMGRIAVVADCAHSLGARKLYHGQWKKSGAIADFSSFSFHAVKNFTTAEGGACTWLPMNSVSDAEIYQMLQLLSLHGQDKDSLAKTQNGSWEYDIIGPWYKCNMTDIMAAIGLRQLDRYPEMLGKRSQIVKRYDAACDEMGILHLYHSTPKLESSKHLYTIRIPGIDVERRNAIIFNMSEKGVATNVHYKPLPMMTAYGGDGSAYPNAYDYYHNLISLPLHSLLTEEDVDYVLFALKQAIKETL